MVAFKHKRVIPKYLALRKLRKLTPKILNIMNRLLLSYFLIYFDETLRTADPQNILFYLHTFCLDYELLVFLRETIKFNVSLKNDNIIMRFSPVVHIHRISCNILLRCQTG